MQRDVAIEIQRGTWRGRPIPAAISVLQTTPSRRCSLDVRAILLHIGALTRPPHLTGMHINDFWAWLRYIPAIEPSGPSSFLHLSQAWSAQDPHQMAILSDDFGVGVATHIANRHLRWRHIVPTSYIKKIAPRLFTPIARSRKIGPDKEPDFICEDYNNRIHVLECKGSQSSSLTAINNQIRRGQDQKDQIQIQGAIAGDSLVISTQLRYAGSRQPTTVRIADPDPTIRVTSQNFQEWQSAIRLGSLALGFRAAGALSLADALLNPEKSYASETFDRIIEGRIVNSRLVQRSDFIVPDSAGRILRLRAAYSLPESLVRQTNELLSSSRGRNMIDEFIMRRSRTLPYLLQERGPFLTLTWPNELQGRLEIA